MTVSDLLEALKDVPVDAKVELLAYSRNDFSHDEVDIEAYYLEASNIFMLDEYVR